MCTVCELMRNRKRSLRAQQGDAEFTTVLVYCFYIRDCFAQTVVDFLCKLETVSKRRDDFELRDDYRL